MADSYDYTSLLRNKCKVCRSPLREQVDLRLLGTDTLEDGTPYTYDEIVDWAAVNGLVISNAGLSRHRTNHLMADVLGAIETQRTVEAIAQATGQTLGLEQAYLQMFLHKAMSALSNVDNLDLSGKGVLGATIRSVEALLKVKKQEVAFSREKMEEAKGKMRAGGLTEETIREIEEQVLGLRR